jgi:hypothetical protein
MTSHIEVALGTFPELVDVFTNELLGNDINQQRKEKLISKLEKINIPWVVMTSNIYLPSAGTNCQYDDEWGSPNIGTPNPVTDYLKKQYRKVGIKDGTLLVSGLLETVSQLDDDTKVFKTAIHVFSHWWDLPSQILQPWRVCRIPTTYLHYRNVDGINVAGIDKLNSLADLIELAKLYKTDKAEGIAQHEAGVSTYIKSPAMRAICNVLNHITHVRQFNRFAKFLVGDDFITELKDSLQKSEISKAQLEEEFESVLDTIHAGLFHTSVDIRQFTYLRLIDLLLG